METKGLTPEAQQEQVASTVVETLEITEQTSQAQGSQEEQPAPETETPAPNETDVQTNQEVADAQTESENDQEEAEKQSNELISKSRSELVEMLSELVAERPVQQIRRNVEAIKIAYYKIQRTEIDAQRDEFVKQGGNPDEFKAEEDAYENKLKEQLSLYRTKRDNYTNNIEKEKEDNYAIKLAIIEELKELTNSSETLHNTFHTFRELQNRWKEAGVVPQEKIKDLWETYHLHVENFYNYIKINNELRDLDLKRNYEAKLLLCEEAEALMLDPSAGSAFHKLQKLHEQWREVGPVTTEIKEQLWNRFKEASTRINKRHQDYFDSVKEEQKNNLILKTELCLKVEELAAQPFTTRKEWSDASDSIIEIQKIWKTIGFAPKKDNNAIYERFRTACDNFFEVKRQYFNGLKSEMDDNLQMKIDLCVQAEALAESDEWKTTTDSLIELQKKWKEIGSTSRKHADTVWKRFRKACDRFFERKAEHFSSVDNKFAENLQNKQQLLIELKELVETKVNLTFDTIKEYQRRWSEIGFVPIKQKETIQRQYKEVVDELFSILRGGEKDRKFEQFKTKISTFKESGARRINSERERLYNKVRQVEADILVWENNIGFFSKSKNASTLVNEVQNKIAKAKAEIAELIEKVKLIDKQNEE